MFDFEKLDVYALARGTAKKVLYFLSRERRRIDPVLQDQLRRAVISIPLNLAEGTGRMSQADKKHFYTIA